jgi:hypothetical protein
VTETRLYLETIEKALAGRKKLIIDGSKFGKRQLFFLDPQGLQLAPGQSIPGLPLPGQFDSGKPSATEERKQ